MIRKARRREARYGPIRLCLWALALLAAASVGSPDAAANSRFNSGYFSNAKVLDHSGREHLFFDDLIAGKIVVLNFVYLGCNDICPLTTSRMAELVDRLGDLVGREVFVYSITMDPQNDRPADLAAYAQAFAAPEGWKFLTGSVDDIKKIRWKLGERSRSLAEHRNDVVLGNARTGEWARSSIYADVEVLARDIRDLAGKPAARKAVADVSDPAAPEHRDRYRFDRPRGEALFIKACSTCHTIGSGDLVGPDLRNVALRRDRKWLERFISDPRGLRQSGDVAAVALSERYRGVIMPDLGLGPVDIDDVLSYIALRSSDPPTAAATAAQERSGVER